MMLQLVSSLALGNKLPRKAKEYHLFDFLSSTSRATFLKFLLTQLNGAHFWIILTEIFASISFRLFSKFIGTDPNAPITTRITSVLTSYIVLISLARS